MNKKLATVIISCLTILLTFLMVVFSAFRLSHPQEIFGQETIQPTVQYDLPCPGILPDHPLYWLKMIRDRIWGSLIRQPYQKTNWLLLMADKRLAAVEKLMVRGQDKLALTTASKAEKYLEKAINNLSNLDLQQRADLKMQLQQAVDKHELVLKNTSQQAGGSIAADFTNLLSYPQGFKTSLLD